ncbi:Hypothetical protein PHPALM_15768 [Phytophthora palmivora]|uniref:FYVE-type domain-containing protein n=1 Tax=Phytophthora palmivora TaxID=4796 RepID=A0A2P4XRE9_9STRA|nr:Hypothetical protein PHPALM_15768 [Phytophthora palmivora]
MDSFVDRETGRRVWARGMRSINHLCCPASQHPDGPVRTYMRVSGMIFRETDRPNVLEHVTFIHIDGRGVPNWVVQQAIATNKKAADNLNQVLKIMRQLKPRQAPGSSTSIGSNSSEGDGSRDCKACGDRVSKWTIAKHCRFCDAILCKKCVEICYHRADASGKNHRMCLSCAIYTGSVNSTSRSMSGLDYSRPNRSQTRVRNATVVERERNLSESTLNPLTKQTSLPTYAMQSSVCSEGERPSISMTDSVVLKMDTTIIWESDTFSNDNMEGTESELQRLGSNHSELLVHHETLKKQLAFKNEQLKRFQAAVKEAQALLDDKPVKSNVTMIQ